jgi:hypothetical protein
MRLSWRSTEQQQGHGTSLAIIAASAMPRRNSACAVPLETQALQSFVPHFLRKKGTHF